MSHESLLACLMSQHRLRKEMPPKDSAEGLTELQGASDASVAPSGLTS